MSMAADKRARIRRATERLRKDYFRYGSAVTVQRMRVRKGVTHIFVYGVANESLFPGWPVAQESLVLIRPGIIDLSPAVALILGYRLSKHGGMLGGGLDARRVFEHLAATLWRHQPRKETQEQPDGRRVELTHGLQFAEMPEIHLI